jgi:hypothetical protein
MWRVVKTGNLEDREKYERAFVAVSYLLGRRGDQLQRALPHLCPSARSLVGALGRAKREVRAQVLAAELARIAHALQNRRLG